MTDPKVSLIIPVYNRADLLVETLDSVLLQTHSNWECIVVDDGSADNSVEVAQSYARRDSRIMVFSRPEGLQQGGNAARNVGFAMSTGDFVNWFDSDDIMHPDFISKKLACFIENPLADAVISKRKVFRGNISRIITTENRTKLTSDILTDFLLIRITWFLPDVMWRREYLQDKNLFREDLFSGQDRDFHIRMLLHKPVLALCDHFLTYCRSHPDNITTNISRKRHLKLSNLAAMESLFIDLDKRNLLSKEIKKFYFWPLVKFLPYVQSPQEHKLLRRTLVRLHVAHPTIYWQWTRYFIALATYRVTGKGYLLLR